MNYAGFIGSAGAVQSPLVSHADLVNLYLQAVDVSASSPTGQALYRIPGLTQFCTTSAVGMRGAISVGTYQFVVMGANLTEIAETGVETIRGFPMAQDQYPATIAFNGPSGGQLAITSGGNLYCYDLATLTLTLELTGEATMCIALDGYFLALNINTGRVRWSDINDGTAWDPTHFFSRSKAPDPLQAMVLGNQGQIILVGESTGEAWYNKGADPNNPFVPNGAFWQYGTRAPFSVTVAGDLVVWQSHTVNGDATFIGMRGYSPATISSQAVNDSLGRLDRTTGITDCECLVYTEDGNTFADFSMLAGKTTWSVNVRTGDWHQRGEWNPMTGAYDVWAPRIHMHAFGKHLVGTRDSNVIYQMAANIDTAANGSGIVWTRIGPPIWASAYRRVSIDRLDLMMDTGLGLATGQGSDPKIRLRTSKDSRTWTPFRLENIGTLGDYGKRVFWTRLGGSEKCWFPEISGSDPVPMRIGGCFIEGTGFSFGQAA